MAIIERDVILMSKDAAGNIAIDKPITSLKNIEANADIKEAPSNNDFIPIVDLQDNESIKMVSAANIGKFFASISTDIEELSPSGTWKIDDFNLINQAVNGVIPKHKTYVCLSDNYAYAVHGTTPEEESYAFRLDVDLIYSNNGLYVVKQEWFQHDGYCYRRYYDTNNSDGWDGWTRQFISDMHTSNSITKASASEIGIHRMSAGTATATTSNCPSGAWYGQY